MAQISIDYGNVSGGERKLEATLLGSSTSVSTSTITLNLSDSLNNFDYLLATMTEVDVNNLKIGGADTRVVLELSDRETFLSSFPKVGYFVSGSSGSMKENTMTLDYVNENTLTAETTGQTRAMYIYGINIV